MSADLIAFIEARLAEDEQAARAAGYHRWTMVDNEIATIGNGRLVVRLEREYDGPHIARHDPARVLREVEAWREIIAECRGAMEWAADLRGNGEPGEVYARHAGSLLGALRRLATVHAAHPDYRQEWTP